MARDANAMHSPSAECIARYNGVYIGAAQLHVASCPVREYQQAERLCALRFCCAPQAYAGRGVCWPALRIALSDGLMTRAGWQARMRAHARRSGQGWAAGVVRAPRFVASRRFFLRSFTNKSENRDLDCASILCGDRG